MNNHKVLIRQFLGQLHSWSATGWGLATALKEKGFPVDLFATDGLKHLPSHLKENVIGYTELNQPKLYGRQPDLEYQMQISYTAMPNAARYLANGKKNRFLIWTYEWCGREGSVGGVLPTGFAKAHQAVDFLCAPSEFSKKIFLQAKIPEEKIKVIPHGIGKEYTQNSKIKLPTNKKFVILTNLAQNHTRKNIPNLLKAYGMAFNKKDDICLLVKAKHKPVKAVFEVDIMQCLNDFKRDFPDHAEIVLYSNYLEDISELYRSVDCLYSLSLCEGFLYPALEALASGKMVICPNWGGQLSIVDKNTALLIGGKEIRATPKDMYWGFHPNAIQFEPNVQEAADKLQFAYRNYQTFNQKLEQERSKIYQRYSWDHIAQQFVGLCSP